MCLCVWMDIQILHTSVRTYVMGTTYFILFGALSVYCIWLLSFGSRRGFSIIAFPRLPKYVYQCFE